MFDFCLEKSSNQIGIENWGVKIREYLKHPWYFREKIRQFAMVLFIFTWFQFSFDEFFFEIVIFEAKYYLSLHSSQNPWGGI